MVVVIKILKDLWGRFSFALMLPTGAAAGVLYLVNDRADVVCGYLARR
jgi:hypothetical protein